jgi:alpha-1,2-mannosyltransferase
MSFQIVVTSVLLVAIALVILRRIFHAHGSRQRTQLLANLSASNNINSGSFKTAWSSQIPGANGTGEGEGKEKGTPPIIAGFLHPYCNAGGGGERVLFAAISYLQRNDPHVLSIVYTGDISPTTKLPVTKAEIIKRCKERFGIELDATKVEFVHLKWRWLIEDAMWKRFTLAGQALGAALLAVEALWKVVPDVFLGK